MPKAFVSHSTLDQDRFVRRLAERLQSDGVETWYAEWALLDGDSLTDRIFEQGIGEADVFIVVLSQFSLKSQWVQAELAVGLVRQIEKKCRLIPIVLDGVDAPVALQSTLQRRITDPADFDSDYDAVLRSIFNEPTTPPLGDPPPYVRARAIGGMTPADAAVHDELVVLMIEVNSFAVDGATLHERCGDLGVSDAAVVEAMHVFDRRGLLKDVHVHGSKVRHVQARPRMLREHVARTTDSRALERRLIADIVNAAERVEVGQLAEEVGVPKIIVWALLDRLDRRFFRLRTMLGGQIYVDQVSPLLARELDA